MTRKVLTKFSLPLVVPSRTPSALRTLNLSTVYIEPSQSHLFVGGVEDIVAPASPPVVSSPAKGSGGGSWSGRAWNLMSGGGEAPTTAEAGDAAASAPAPAEGGATGEGGDSVEGGGEEERKRAGARDIRAFGTLLIEIILKCVPCFFFLLVLFASFCVFSLWGGGEGEGHERAHILGFYPFVVWGGPCVCVFPFL